MKNKRIIFAFMALDFVLIILFVGASIFIYDRVSAVEAHCDARPEDKDFTPDNFTRVNFDTTLYLMTNGYATVTFKSRGDDLDISGWYVPNESNNPAPTVIIVHGVNDCKQRSFTLTTAGMLHNNGFNVLLMDMRDHGESEIEDGRHAAGTEEYRDILGAWDWLIAEKDASPESIGLMGFSLGGATSIIAASEEPQVAAIWSDSSFADIKDITGDELARSNFPRFMAVPGLFMGRIISEDDLTSKNPLDLVKNLDGRPIFIVHGKADERIDVKYASDLAHVINANGGSVDPWLVDGALHIESIWAEPEMYEENMVKFFGDSLSLPEFSAE